MSDLLNEASLVLIPSGIKASKVYAQIPEDGSGDMTFARASDATRVNSLGLVEKVRTNLVTYSEQFTQYPPWLIQNIVRADNVATAPNGTTTAGKIYPSVNSSNPVIYCTSISVVNGLNYTVSIYAKSAGKNWIFIRTINDLSAGVWFNLSNGTIGTQTSATGVIESVGNGWYRCSVIGAPTSTSGRGVYLVVDGDNTVTATANGTDGIYIWGAQLEVSDFGPTAYIPTTSSAVSVGPYSNIPRLNYQNGGGGCPSLLLEAQRTNSLWPSEDFANSNWTNYGGASVTSNTAISPDGYVNADTLDCGTTTALYNPNGASGGVIPFTASIYVKKVNFEVFRFGMTDDTLEEFSYNYNLDTLAVSAATTPSVWTNTSGTITSVGNGWFRLTVTGTKGVSGVARMVVKGQSSNKQYYIWGAQLEAGSFVSSYIPTLGTSVTRVADACYKTGISSLIGQTEGTMFIDFTYLSKSGNNRFSISDGSNANWIFIGTPEDGATNASRFYIKTNNTVHVDVGSSSFFTFGQRYKLALAYKSGQWAVYSNGSLLYSGTDSISAVSSPLSVLNFANASGGVTDSGETINQATLFPTRLTNTQLQELTS